MQLVLGRCFIGEARALSPTPVVSPKTGRDGVVVGRTLGHGRGGGVRRRGEPAGRDGSAAWVWHTRMNSPPSEIKPAGGGAAGATSPPQINTHTGAWGHAWQCRRTSTPASASRSTANGEKGGEPSHQIPPDGSAGFREERPATPWGSPKPPESSHPESRGRCGRRDGVNGQQPLGC